MTCISDAERDQIMADGIEMYMESEYKRIDELVKLGIGIDEFNAAKRDRCRMEVFIKLLRNGKST